MSKKTTIAIMVILIVIALLGVAGYYILSTNLWTEDGKIEDGKTEIIEHIRNMEDPKAKEESVQLLLDSNKITQKEADEILGK